MAIVQAKNKKEYAIENQSVLRLLSTGIKLTNAVLKSIGLNPKDKVNYAYDDVTGELFIFKGTEGSTLGETKTFTNSGLKNALLALAKGKKIEGTDGVVSAATETKAGTQIHFNVSETAKNEGGVDYFSISFSKAIHSEKSEKAEKAPKKEAAAASFE